MKKNIDASYFEYSPPPLHPFYFPLYVPIHYEKKGCFVIRLAIQFLNYRGHLQLIIYMVQFIATQLQFYQNNLFSTTMQLH